MNTPVFVRVLLYKSARGRLCCKSNPSLNLFLPSRNFWNFAESSMTIASCVNEKLLQCSTKTAADCSEVHQRSAHRRSRWSITQCRILTWLRTSQGHHYFIRGTDRWNRETVKATLAVSLRLVYAQIGCQTFCWTVNKPVSHDNYKIWETLVASKITQASFGFFISFL